MKAMKNFLVVAAQVESEEARNTRMYRTLGPVDPCSGFTKNWINLFCKVFEDVRVSLKFHSRESLHVIRRLILIRHIQMRLLA